MAFNKRPLTEPNEWWATLTRKINDALEALHGFAADLTGKVKNSIEADTDGKAQLRNDLTDAEILPNLVYGTDSDNNRGWIPAPAADMEAHVIGGNLHTPDTIENLSLKVSNATLVGVATVQTLTNKTLGSGTKVGTGEHNIGDSGDSQEIDWANGINQRITLDDDCTITFTGGSAGSKYLLKIIQDGTGDHTPTFPGTVRWAGGALPTWTTDGNAIDIVTFYFDGSVYWAVGNTDFKEVA